MLEAQHLSGGYPGKTVLEDVSLSLEKGGELIAVLGLNGSGKSTLLKILAAYCRKNKEPCYWTESHFLSMNRDI